MTRNNGYFLFNIILFIILVVICCVIVDRFHIPDTMLANSICILLFIVIPYVFILWKISKYH